MALLMENQSNELLILAAKQLRGSTRRIFIANLCNTLCEDSARKTEHCFGWVLATVEKGLADRALTVKERPSRPSSANKGRMPWEKRYPQIEMDIRLIVEPHTQSDPELKPERCYTNLSAAEVLTALQQKGYPQSQLPSERTMRDIVLCATNELARQHPKVHSIAECYDEDEAISHAEMKAINARLHRSELLPKYDITIKPKKPRGK